MKKKTDALLALLMVIFLIACGGGGGSGSGDSAGSGELAVSLTDASTDRYKAVYVTIDDVQVHKGGSEAEAGNWQSLGMTEPITVNLLNLVNGVREALGLTTLQAGHYSQMRLIIGDDPDDLLNIFNEDHPHANYLILQDNSVHELKVPSGPQTGIKIVHGFDIAANQTTELILDFDAGRSVVQAGASRQWLLKPTIKVVEMTDYAIVEGFVSRQDQSPVEGALVSLQVYDAGAADPKDQVIVQAATVSDGDEDPGHYKLFVRPGSYTLVVWKSGLEAAGITPVAPSSGETVQMNVQLSGAVQGLISGSAALPGADDDQYVTLSIRRAEGGIMIEVASLNVANGGDYALELPEGGYQLVASSYGYETTLDHFTIAQGTPVSHDIVLSSVPE